jgi:hypothetical protein
MFWKFSVVFLSLSFSFNSVAGQDGKDKPIPKYRQEIKDQRSDITKGVVSGQLTIKEAEALRERQRTVLRMAKKLNADGKLSQTDKKKLAAVERKLDSLIVKESTDGERGGNKNRAQLRQFNQRERVKDGVSTGRINEGEEKLLRQYIAKNQKLLNSAMKDGLLSAPEVQKIERAQDRVNDNILTEIKDGQQATR